MDWVDWAIQARMLIPAPRAPSGNEQCHLDVRRIAGDIRTTR